MNRSVVVLTPALVVAPYHNLSHRDAEWLALDLRANEGWDAQVVRLPRRLFRGRLRAYHNDWALRHGVRPSELLQPKIAILNADEDARWEELFCDFLNDGMSEQDADAKTFRQMRNEFPRLRGFDGFAPEVAR